MRELDSDLVPSADAIWQIAGYFLLTLAATVPLAFFNPNPYTLIALLMSVSMGGVFGWMSRSIRRGNGALCLVAGWLGLVASVTVVAAMGWLWFGGMPIAAPKLSRPSFWILLVLVLPALVKLTFSSFMGYWAWRDRPDRGGGFDVVAEAVPQEVIVSERTADR